MGRNGRRIVGGGLWEEIEVKKYGKKGEKEWK